MAQTMWGKKITKAQLKSIGTQDSIQLRTTNFDSENEVKTHFARCRKIVGFTFSKDALARKEHVCCHCNNRINPEDGHRGKFNPKTKKFLHMHYRCAWQTLLSDVYGPLYDRFMGR